MPAIRFADLHKDLIRPGVERRLAYTDHLMMTIIDFNDGPQAVPDPPHAHPHEQVTYVAAGEITFFLEGEPAHLAAGDVFTVPPDKPHSIQLLSEHVRLVDCFMPIREDFLK